MSAPAEQPYEPSRSPYWIEDTEGPQTISELKAALAPWPQELLAFTARLEAAQFGEIRELIKRYRMIWLSLTHPTIRAAEANSETGNVTSWDEVMADYDENFELRPGAAIAETGGASA
ncbi:hypothetical protein [Streptomyces sp. G-5]|uniref:hypothetical protein n=1 Tax=Streptomyces sp. G-5 TaxID=2977231 RepID=UPI0021D18842|nr:hypothetical protein [Streptomyces sp. G-5]MCU4750281.1 hypothetical protein [Streptomyces sp. G-5]